MRETKKKPLVSIIIPTYDSQETIGNCLKTIEQQTYPHIETILVDRFSRDHTSRIANKFGAQIITLDGERSAAKNYGAKRARGQLILFMDSDMALNQKAVEECIKEQAKTNVDAVIIPEIYISQGLFGEYKKFEKTSISQVRELLEIPRFYKKQVFLRIGGFDEELVCGEDFDFFQRFKTAGYKTAKITLPTTHLENISSLEEIALKAHHYGRSLPALIKKNPKTVLRRYGRIRLASFKSTGQLSKSPKFFIGFISMKMLESVAYLTGILIELVLTFFTSSSEKAEPTKSSGYK